MILFFEGVFLGLINLCYSMFRFEFNNGCPASALHGQNQKIESKISPVHLKKMGCQVEQKEYFRPEFLFEFNEQVSTTEAIRNICEVDSKDAIGESAVRKWSSHLD